MGCTQKLYKLRHESVFFVVAKNVPPAKTEDTKDIFERNTSKRCVTDFTRFIQPFPFVKKQN